MLSSEIIVGRRIGVVLQPGDDVIPSIVAACIQHRIEQGFIPVFLGAFRSARLIASGTPVADPEPPLGREVEVAYSEGTGSGSITLDPTTGEHRVHLHVSLGVKDEGGAAYAGHLLGGATHYTAELVIVEVISPTLARVADPAAFGLENLVFRPSA